VEVCVNVRRILSASACAAAAALALPGCTSGRSQPHPEDLGRLLQASPPPDVPPFRPLSREERGDLVLAPPAAYRIGPGDVLNIQGLGEEFKGFGETSRGEVAGTQVKPDGRLYLPHLGAVPAAGKTVLEVQEAVREALLRFQREPFVSVDVLQYRSQKYFVLGEVERPGVAPVDGQVTLLEALAAAGGFKQGANVEHAYVVRDRMLLPVSLADIVRRGDLSQNVVLQDKDLVFVPSLEERRVYVLGEVGAPGVYPMGRDGATLVEAVARAGGLRPETADVNKVRVFRGGWCRPECFTISACELLVHGDHIRLFPGDRVFVAPTQEATYARALQLVSPFLTTPLSLATTALAIDAYTRN
jgi:polysaccharide export outer membrane protein